MKIKCIICALLASVMFFSACNAGKEEDNKSDSESEVSESVSEEVSALTSEEIPYSGKTYVVNTIDELRSLEVSEELLTVTVRGYYAPEDGGGGTFFWNIDSKKSDNGGTVIQTTANEKGRFIRLCDENYRNVRWFGAKGTGKDNDTKAIQAAINSLPIRGGTVSLPGGNYVITSPINIGNGDAGETWSTQMAVKLVGEGAGFGVTGDSIPTVITAAKNIDAMVKINGRISGITLDGIDFNANRQAKQGVYATSVCGLQILNTRIQQFTDKGLVIMGGKMPTGNYNIYNRFENLEVSTAVDNTSCLFIDGDFGAINDTWLTTFMNCSFDVRDSKNSAAAYFKFVDSISFFNCKFRRSDASSVGIVFDALNNRDFPSGIGFYDCSVSSTKVIEDDNNKIRAEFFYGFKTQNGEEIPEHYLLYGITDEGVPFHMDNLVAEGGGDGGDDGIKLPTKKNSFDLYSSGTYEHKNLAADKSEVSVLFKAGKSVTGGTLYLPNYDNSIGTVYVDIYSWDTDYATTKKSSPVYSTSFVNFPNNSYERFEIKTPLEAGNYLLVTRASTVPGDYGAGVWCQKNANGIKTFYNGEEVDFGLVGTVYLGD